LRVDITAKAPPETPPDQLLLMTQRLLAERFLLTMHRERRAVAHGELVVVGNGPKRCDSLPIPLVFGPDGVMRVRGTRVTLEIVLAAFLPGARPRRRSPSSIPQSRWPTCIR
jgi:hypothetical protein